MSRGTLRLPADLTAQIEELRRLARVRGIEPATLPQTALVLLRRAVEAALAEAGATVAGPVLP